MNEERRLLERVMYRIPSLVISEHDLDLVDEIKELLAQPEQEPLTPRQGLEEYKRGYARAELDLKREPLSGEQIEAAREGNTITVHAFARAIEKAHGIGGGE